MICCKPVVKINHHEHINENNPMDTLLMERWKCTAKCFRAINLTPPPCFD